MCTSFVSLSRRAAELLRNATFKKATIIKDVMSTRYVSKKDLVDTA